MFRVFSLIVCVIALVQHAVNAQTITLTGHATSDTTVLLSWVTSNVNQFSYFIVYKSRPGESYREIPDSMVTEYGVSSYTATGLSPGETVSYRVDTTTGIQSNNVAVTTTGTYYPPCPFTIAIPSMSMISYRLNGTGTVTTPVYSDNTVISIHNGESATLLGLACTGGLNPSMYQNQAENRYVCSNGVVGVIATDGSTVVPAVLPACAQPTVCTIPFGSNIQDITASVDGKYQNVVKHGGDSIGLSQNDYFDLKQLVCKSGNVPVDQSLLQGRYQCVSGGTFRMRDPTNGLWNAPVAFPQCAPGCTYTLPPLVLFVMANVSGTLIPIHTDAGETSFSFTSANTLVAITSVQCTTGYKPVFVSLPLTCDQNHQIHNANNGTLISDTTAFPMCFDPSCTVTLDTHLQQAHVVRDSGDLTSHAGDVLTFRDVEAFTLDQFQCAPGYVPSSYTKDMMCSNAQLLTWVGDGPHVPTTFPTCVPGCSFDLNPFALISKSVELNYQPTDSSYEKNTYNMVTNDYITIRAQCAYAYEPVFQLASLSCNADGSIEVIEQFRLSNTQTFTYSNVALDLCKVYVPKIQCLIVPDPNLRSGIPLYNIYGLNTEFATDGLGRSVAVLNNGTSIQVSSTYVSCIDGYVPTFTGTRTYSCGASAPPSLSVSDNGGPPGYYTDGYDTNLCVLEPGSCLLTLDSNVVNLTASLGVGGPQQYTGGTIVQIPNHVTWNMIGSSVNCIANDWENRFDKNLTYRYSCQNGQPQMFDTNFRYYFDYGVMCYSCAAYTLTDMDTDAIVLFPTQCPCPDGQTRIDGQCQCPPGTRFASNKCTSLCNYYIYDPFIGYATKLIRTGILQSWSPSSNPYCLGDPSAGMIPWYLVGSVYAHSTEMRCDDGYKLDTVTNTCRTTCDYYIYNPHTGYATDVISTGTLGTRLNFYYPYTCHGEPAKNMYAYKQIGSLHNHATECRCLTGTTLNPNTNVCDLNPCEIRMSTFTPRMLVWYGNNTGQLVINSAGHGVFVIGVGFNATVTNFCPSTGGPFLNGNQALNLYCPPTPGTVRELQIPVCVNTCPKSQSWNGQECVCDDNTEDICHTCGPLGNCNTRGTCQIAYNGVVNNTFCSSCTDNYDGDYCENEPEAQCTTKGDVRVCDLEYEYVQCDCGAKWLSKEPPSPELAFQVQSSIGLYTSYYEMDRQIESPPRPPGSDPVTIENQKTGSLAAAKYACYNDPDCDGITWLPYSKRFTPFKLSSNATLKWETPGWIPPTGLDSTYEIYRIDRYSLYNCANFEPNYYWYYFHSGYRYEIETEYVGQNGCIDGKICGHSLVEPLSQLSTSIWYSYAVKHWKTIGHKKRYSPNPTCILSPTLYDANSHCAVARSGCEQTHIDSPPCGGHGYCVQSSVSWRDPKPYKCDCKMFSESDQVYGDYALMPKYMGYACQYETATFCTTPGKINVTNFCNGHEERCQPSQVSDNIPLASKIQDYIPACNCGEFQNVFNPSQTVPASQFTGAYCNISLCGDPKNCNYMEDGLSKCVDINAGSTNLTSKWKCSCGWTATGDVCEQKSTACVNPDETDAQEVCTGKGVCMASGLPSNLYANNALFPNYQSNSAWCSCRDGHTGKYCWDVACTKDELVPGHGLCNNQGRNAGCFHSWRGPSCNISKCTETGGTNLLDYSGCNCPHSSGLTINHKVDNGTDYSCWPRCPDTGDSINGVCGNSVINTCALDKTGPTTKTAVCQCNNDEGWIPYTVNDPVLGSVTSCKPFCSVNGVIAKGWSPTHQIPCICNATSGMISNALSPRCDVSKCEPNGDWDGNRCVCKSSLYYGETCQLTYCNNNATDVNEGHPDSGTGTFCECNRGYTNSNSRKRDCDASICGKWGDLNANYQTDRPLQELCTCRGIFRTAPCTNADCTPYCTSSLCEYGGSPYTVSTTFPTLCTCPFPFKNLQPGGYCSLLNCANSQRTKEGRCDTHYCGENGRVTIDLKCECMKYWKSSSLINTTSAGNGVCTKQPCCDISPCQNGGIWNQTSSKCTCPAGNKYAGDLCETLMTTVIITAPTSPPPAPIVCGSHGTSIANVFCSCKDYWSGSTCTISPCGTHGSFNSTSLGCNCATNYVGTFCETFIPPATVPPPTTKPPTTTTTPPPSRGAASKMFDIDMLSLFIFVLIVVVIV